MHWPYRLNLALATVAVLLASCFAQEVAFIDLTAVEPRIDLRRPKATSETTGRRGGSLSTTHCADSAHKTGALDTSLVSLDRTYYQVSDEPFLRLRCRTPVPNRSVFRHPRTLPIFNRRIRQKLSLITNFRSPCRFLQVTGGAPIWKARWSLQRRRSRQHDVDPSTWRMGSGDRKGTYPR